MASSRQGSSGAPACFGATAIGRSPLRTRQETTMLRTHTCGQLRAADVGAHVTLTGWVNRRREHGGLTFLNLRDRYGLTQVVFDAEAAPDAFAAAGDVGPEWVVAVDGAVRRRPEGQANPDMPTGEIEVLAEHL